MYLGLFLRLSSFSSASSTGHHSNIQCGMNQQIICLTRSYNVEYVVGDCTNFGTGRLADFNKGRQQRTLEVKVPKSPRRALRFGCSEARFGGVG